MIVNEYREVLLKSYYLDDDGIIVRRNYDSKVKRFKKHDKVNTVSTKQGYDLVWVPGTLKKMVPIHQLITILRGIEIPDGHAIDHIDGDISNHSADNLRVVTRGTNNRNAKMRKDNTTGYTGIHKMPNGLYIVRKWINGVRKYKSTRVLEEAVEYIRQLEQEGIACGYTQRHGK